MTDLLKKTKAALEAGRLVVSEVNETEAMHTRNAGTDYKCRQWFVEHGDTLLNMARALISAENLLGELEVQHTVFGLTPEAAQAVAAFRAAMEGRTDD